MKFYSSIEASKILGVTRKAVYNHLVSGKMKSMKIGQRFVIAESELKKWQKLPQKLTRNLVRVSSKSK